MRFANIDEFEVVNGEGAGVSLFVQGCNFHCPGCFNQETWDFDGGEEWTEAIKNMFVELAGRKYIERISILGGEPLSAINVKHVYYLLKEIKELYPSKKIWVYTGFTCEQLGLTKISEYKYFSKKDLLLKNYCDILVDGPFEIDKKDLTLPYRGSSNQRIIDVRRTLDAGEIVLWRQ